MNPLSFTLKPTSTTTTTGPVSYLRVTNFGATLTHLVIRDAANVERDIVLGFNTPEQYVASKNADGYAYYGSTVGRIANRISGGAFELDGKTFTLPKNNGSNNLHGGKEAGWDGKFWKVGAQTSDSITFEISSENGDGGFPGSVEASVTYTLTPTELVLTYSAQISPQSPVDSTIVSLTNHAYFNLSGMKDANVDNQLLEFSNDVTGWLRRDPKMDYAPSGEVVPISAEPDYDFRTQSPMGAKRRGDFDDFFVLSSNHNPSTPCATVKCPSTGITMSLTTSEPGFQLYVPQGATSFSYKDTQGEGKYGARAAFCLEASRFPDAVNKPDWRQQVVLKKGEKYEQRTVYSLRL